MTSALRNPPRRGCGRRLRRLRRRPRPALLVLLACLGVLIGVPTALAAGVLPAAAQPDDLGARPALEPAAAPYASLPPLPLPDSLPAAGPQPSPQPGSARLAVDQPPAPVVRRRSAAPGKPAPPVPAPVEVRLPARDIRAPVVPVGVAVDGTMELPEDPDVVGWYRFAGAPGAASGSAVLAGHVDSRSQGPGALFELRSARPGDEVEVRRADDRVLRYTVVARERLPRSTLPVAELFARTGAPRLTLVTCGGEFDEERRSYTDNVVVTAVPLDEHRQG